ncbi:MAG: 4-alpha-glucanotransferase [Gammaproteobacteria bacterium]|nr:4-alpha-glucanotransferase [Gammaproteobacteria bacterium]
MTDSSSQILPPGRQAGVCLHIASLSGPYGIGELGQSAHEFIDTMTRMQLAVWQFLPTGPTAYGDSPYQPLSTFAGNEMLIDVRDLIARGLLDAAEASELAALPREYVDYGALIPAKTRLLQLAAGRFEERATPELKAACDDFVLKNNDLWLHDYALYRILKTRHGEQPWPDWAAEYVHREPAAMQALEVSADAGIADIKVIQFLFFEQWDRMRAYANERGIRLFGDMPICIALDSADAWAHPELLRIDRDGRPDAVAGVPPDYFSEDGQLWGNPLYDWEVHAANGYRWWVERLRASAELADIVRIDHFRGFEAYWSVPADSDTARSGSWEPGPGDAIFDAMSAALGNLPIVAEDLGVITPEVEALRDRHEIPGMVVLQFDIADEQFDLDSVGPNSVCYTGTHDNDTTLGWFRGSPNDIRSPAEIEATRQTALRKTGGTPETIHTDLIRAAFSTKARLAIAPLQDYLGLGSEARINTPGIAGGNWRWRVLDSQLTPELCDNTASLVIASQRGLSAHEQTEHRILPSRQSSHP